MMELYTVHEQLQQQFHFVGVFDSWDAMHQGIVDYIENQHIQCLKLDYEDVDVNKTKGVVDVCKCKALTLRYGPEFIINKTTLNTVNKKFQS